MILGGPLATCQNHILIPSLFLTSLLHLKFIGSFMHLIFKSVITYMYSMSKKRPQVKKKKKKGKEASNIPKSKLFVPLSATWLHKGPDPQDHPVAKSC